MAITAGYGNAKFVDDAQVCGLFFIFFISFRPKERERETESRILIDFFPAGLSLSLSLCPIIKFPRRVYDARERSFPALRSRKRETTT